MPSLIWDTLEQRAMTTSSFRSSSKAGLVSFHCPQLREISLFHHNYYQLCNVLSHHLTASFGNCAIIATDMTYCDIMCSLAYISAHSVYIHNLRL